MPGYLNMNTKIKILAKLKFLGHQIYQQLLHKKLHFQINLIGEVKQLVSVSNCFQTLNIFKSTKLKQLLVVVIKSFEIQTVSLNVH